MRKERALGRYRRKSASAGFISADLHLHKLSLGTAPPSLGQKRNRLRPERDSPCLFATISGKVEWRRERGRERGRERERDSERERVKEIKREFNVVNKLYYNQLKNIFGINTAPHIRN